MKWPPKLDHGMDRKRPVESRRITAVGQEVRDGSEAQTHESTKLRIAVCTHFARGAVEAAQDDSDAIASVVSRFLSHLIIEHPAVNCFGVGSSPARGAENHNRKAAIFELTASRNFCGILGVLANAGTLCIKKRSTRHLASAAVLRQKPLKLS